VGSIVKFGGAPVWVEGMVVFNGPAPGPICYEMAEGTEFAPMALTQWVGAFSILDGTGGLEIGEYTVISPGCHIYSHVNDLPLKGTDRPVERRKTIIGSNVYLGPQVVVTAGVCIGDGAVIGAGAYIDRSVEAGMKVIPVQRKEYEHVGK